MKKSTRYVAATFCAVLLLQVGFNAANRYLWPEHSMLRQLNIFSDSNASEAAMAAMKDFDVIQASGPMQLVVTKAEGFSVRLTPPPGERKYIFATQDGRVLRLVGRYDLDEHDPVTRVEIGMPEMKSIQACFKNLVIEGRKPKSAFHDRCPE